VAATAAVPGSGSKGRATPKRREAEKGRRRAVTAPQDRKEAYRAARERQRAERVRSMQALRTGDERHLPPRDRGPVRRYVRDLVDARRSVAEFFLPIALLILVLTFTSSAALELLGSTLWLALVVLIVVDSIVLARRLKKGLKRSFPDQNHKGALPYALMRSMQIRRFRLPPPRVKAGRRR
jgi:Flp pilus assembly protein TadB